MLWNALSLRAARSYWTSGVGAGPRAPLGCTATIRQLDYRFVDKYICFVLLVAWFDQADFVDCLRAGLFLGSTERWIS